MASAIFRMLALFALLLIPAGMAGGPALAQSSTAVSGHCDASHAPDQAPAQPQAHCAACAALPALDLPNPEPAFLPKPAPVVARAHIIAGIEPEIATPPPKLS